MKTVYQVIVGNIGTMEYTSKKLALECFNTYVSLSKSDTGRASGEDVTLMANDDPIREYLGSINALIY